MYAYRNLLTKKLSIVSKKSFRIPKQLNARNEFSTSRHHLSNFKDNEGDQMNVSIFNIKRSLKATNTEFEDGFTNIKTHCPVCEPSGNTDIYINKTTGKIVLNFVDILP